MRCSREQDVILELKILTGRNPVADVRNPSLFFSANLQEVLIKRMSKQSLRIIGYVVICLAVVIGECGRAKGELFVGGRQPWCQPDVASNDEVQDVVMRCPTGALSVRITDGLLPEKGGPLTVKAVKDGPLLLNGNVTISGGSGRNSWSGKQGALCRCGASDNKPFCHGSHKKIGCTSDP